MYCACHAKSIFADPLRMSHACHRFWECHTKPSRFAHSWQGAKSLAPATQNDASTYKSGANMWCFVHFDFGMCFSSQQRQLFEHLIFQKCSERGVFCAFFYFEMCFAPQRRALFNISSSKVLRTCDALNILISKYASCHNSVNFFNKVDPSMKCFVHFDFQMCFAPQWRSLFQHHNCQKCSGHEVVLAFSLPNVLRATTACNFSSQPEGSAPAALASLLFDPPEPQISGKTQ